MKKIFAVVVLASFSCVALAGSNANLTNIRCEYVAGMASLAAQTRQEGWSYGQFMDMFDESVTEDAPGNRMAVVKAASLVFNGSRATPKQARSIIRDMCLEQPTMFFSK